MTTHIITKSKGSNGKLLETYAIQTESNSIEEAIGTVITSHQPFISGLRFEVVLTERSSALIYVNGPVERFPLYVYIIKPNT